MSKGLGGRLAILVAACMGMAAPALARADADKSSAARTPTARQDSAPTAPPSARLKAQPHESSQHHGSKTAASSAHQHPPAASKPKPTPFSYAQIIDQAKTLAGQDYHAPPTVPQFLRALGPDVYGQIQFKREQALWAAGKLPFQIMFYPPGSYYAHAVRMHVVDNGKVSDYPFNRNNFTYPNDGLKNRMPDHVGYAGLKVLHQLDTPGKFDEILSFLGASYFRSLGTDEHYGMSARGLAIDTGNLAKGEEFPDFIQFWLVNPGKTAKSVTVYALLDSKSVAGAYKFVITPGKATHTHVEETLFTRLPIDKLGIAPLTSMFTWGENSLARIDDYRPEAHDSDGMLISAANGEWLWRPLYDPQTLILNQFLAPNVRGFGLIQRDRNFDHYQDLDFEYERRPNAWVTPDGDWGNGHLELVEIPSDSEINDNMGLYWIPQDAVKAHQRLHFAYDIKWSRQLAVPESLGHSEATRIGMAAVAPGQQKNQVRVAIEFVGGELGKLKDANSVQPRVNAARDVTINDIQAIRNPHTGGWRLTFQVPTSALDTPLELRAYLADANGGGLTETWSYALKTP